MPGSLRALPASSPCDVRTLLFLGKFSMSSWPGRPGGRQRLPLGHVPRAPTATPTSLAFLKKWSGFQKTSDRPFACPPLSASEPTGVADEKELREVKQLAQLSKAKGGRELLVPRTTCTRFSLI